MNVNCIWHTDEDEYYRGEESYDRKDSVCSDSDFLNSSSTSSTRSSHSPTETVPSNHSSGQMVWDPAEHAKNPWLPGKFVIND